jgi:hypothetical protein
MSIKKFFIGMAILLSVSLFVIGCPTEVEEKTVDRWNTAGAAGTGLEGLQDLLDNPKVNPVTYVGTGALAIGTGQIVVPSGKTLVVNDGVTLSTGTFAVAGSLTLGTGKKVTVTGAGTVAGVDEGDIQDNSGGNAKKGPVAATVAAAKEAFDDGDDVVLVLSASVADLTAANVPAGKTLYVSGTLPIEATAPAPAGEVVALGTVSVSDDVNLVSVVGTGDGKLNIASATLTNSAEVTVTLPTAVTVKAINVGSDDLTIAGATGLTAKVSGTGALKLAAVTAANITGTGKVQFSAATTFSAASSIETGDSGYVAFLDGFKSAGSSTTIELSGNVFVLADKNIEFGHASGTVTLKAGTGLITGTGPESNTRLLGVKADTVLTPADATTVIVVKETGLEVNTAGITFDGPVDFAGDLTLTAVPATFKGDVSFVVGKKIVLTAATSIITLGPTVHLGTPTASGVPVVYGSVIRNPAADTDDVTLTPANNTKLTFTATRTITQDSSASTAAAHGIAIGGEASLPAGATYIVASAANTVGTLTVDTGNELLVADGVLGASQPADTGYGHNGSSSKLVLTGASGANGAKLTGAGSVKAGTVTIVGGTAGTASWQAVTGNITIEADTITAASSGVLTAVTGTAKPSITVPLTGELTIAAATTINLAGTSSAEIGTITLTSGTGPGKLTFAANTSKVLVGAGAGGDAITGLTSPTIGTKAIVVTGLAKEDFQNASEKLVQLGGATAGNFTASTTGSNDVVISSTVAAAGT